MTLNLGKYVRLTNLKVVLKLNTYNSVQSKYHCAEVDPDANLISGGRRTKLLLTIASSNDLNM